MAFTTGLPRAIAGFRGLAAGASSSVERMVNEDHIRLAVTGLSRAGKTVFITSLVQNLLALGQGRNVLPKITQRMTAKGASRLRGVTVLPTGATLLPYFDPAQKLAALTADKPLWPDATVDLAQVSLGIEIERQSPFGQRLGHRRIQLDILDYPGEWLLDLPLLEQTFNAWSAATLDLLRQSPRRECSERFLAFIAIHRFDDRAEESTVRRGHELYREALQACRTRHGLRYLQPGRFVCPGTRSDAPFMWFFPISMPEHSCKPGTVGAVLQDRFEAYKRDMRLTFFDSHFASFNRQVMLVDVLSAVYAGRAAFEDTTRAVSELGAALRYGTNTVARGVAAGVMRGVSQILPAAIGGPADTAAHSLSNRRIERVTFVATKADHVPAIQRDHLRNLLRALATASGREPVGAGSPVTYRTAAAILSTQDGTSRLGGHPVQVVEGVKLGESVVRPFYVGEVPGAIPPDSFWAERYLEIPQFRPPPIDGSGVMGIPHLDLDRVLDDVIGDLL